eukprot:1998524-Pleurochrysis_carterae.AAC.3
MVQSGGGALSTQCREFVASLDPIPKGFARLISCICLFILRPKSVTKRGATRRTTAPRTSARTPRSAAVLARLTSVRFVKRMKYDVLTESYGEGGSDDSVL